MSSPQLKKKSGKPSSLRKAAPRGKDRRNFRRLPLRKPVNPLYVMKVPRDTRQGRGRDVSFTGIGVETAKQLKIGDRVSFNVHLPKGRKMELVEGVVRWIVKNPSSYSVGIQFIKIRMVDKLFLIAYLDRAARAKQVGTAAINRTKRRARTKRSSK